MWQKSQQLAGEATLPDSVISHSQVDKHGTCTSLFSLKRILVILCKQTVWSVVDYRFQNLICTLGNWINNWFFTGVKKHFEGLVGDTRDIE